MCTSAPSCASARAHPNHPWKGMYDRNSYINTSEHPCEPFHVDAAKIPSKIVSCKPGRKTVCLLNVCADVCPSHIWWRISGRICRIQSYVLDHGFSYANPTIVEEEKNVRIECMETRLWLLVLRSKWDLILLAVFLPLHHLPHLHNLLHLLHRSFLEWFLCLDQCFHQILCSIHFSRQLLVF